ncbi:MAG: prolipoprotein diacylglyceryl transferase family protein [Patescibacteria group bacterium]|nr:prolipoprotein diacylglyceryl transferase family protein [Patescibacteria group bacterium]
MIPYFTFQEINLGIVTIQVWGLMAFLGFLTALFFSIKEGRENGIDEENIWDIMIFSLIGIIIGSRVFYVILNFREFNNLVDIFNIYNNGGFSFLGGVIVASILIYLYSKIKKINIYKLADTLVFGAVIAVTITRLGCFFIYDHLGKITDLPWGRLYVDGIARHPVALYHIISGIIILCLIQYLKKKHLKEGTLATFFVLFYSFFRFFLDFARCSDLEICDSRYLGLTYTQLILLMVIPFSVYILKKKMF